jgi:hypothetical protein
MDTNGESSVSALKAAVAICGSVVFLIVSVVVAWQARHYQITGQPMPNGKGGFMTFGDGYLIAVVFLLFSVACVMQARRCFKAR